jgi:hypothetical protein
MTRSSPAEPAGPAVLVGAGAPPAEHDGDVGDSVPANKQPLTRASTTSAADVEPNPRRDVDMGYLLRGWSATIEAALASVAEPGPIPTERCPGGGFIQSPLRARERAALSRPPAHRFGSGQLAGG